MTYKNFTVETDADGIALVTWDMPDRSMNVFTEEVMDELEKIVDAVAADAAVKGAVITSGKDSFSGGADLNMLKRMLARLVSAVGRRPVTDATSGFWALGPRAVSLLATHHPRGYPEPELHLFLSHNRLGVEEVGVPVRERLSGQSSLTVLRLVAAAARVLLAMVIVPLRARVGP